MATPSASGADALDPNAPNGALVAPMGTSPNGSNPFDASVLSAQGMPSSSNNPSASRSVKRPRPVKSCTECRKRKLKCDRNLPCAQCQKSHRNCKYAAEQDSSVLSDGSDAEMGEAPRPPKRQCVPAVQTPSGGSVNNLGTGPGSGSAYATARGGDAYGAPPLDELSWRIDRLEQHVLAKSPVAGDLGGSLRLPLHPEMIRGLTVKGGAERTRFFGQSSVRVLLNLFDEAKEFLTNHSKSDDFRAPMSMLFKLHKYILADHKRLLTPMPVYVTSATPVQNRMKHILAKLPGREVCDRLLRSYITTTETIYRIVHIPTFMRQYELYWKENVHSDAFLAQLLLILATGSRFETESKGLDPNAVDGVHIPTACELVRSWLYGLKGKQLVDFCTLQTEVLLIHTQRMIKSNPHELWTQLGAIVRAAQTMGLHRDPSEFATQIPTFTGELRRRLWFTVMEMDLHISLVCNLPTIVREDEFTCRKPLNVDDVELSPNMVDLPPGRPIDQNTDNRIQVYASMTLETRLKALHMVSRIDSIRDYTEVLALGGKLERHADDISILFPRDSSLSDAEKSKQWRGRVILDMHVRRPLLALYRPFALGASNPPAQIAQSYLRSSLVILQYLDELDPRLVQYHNVSDMYHQVLKKDMLQASLSLCYYIRAGLQPAAANGSALGGGPYAAALSPLSIDAGLGSRSDSPVAWSPSRLINTVEKSMDLLMQNVGGSDVKDIIALAVVLASVQSTSTEQKLQEIRRSLTTVLETCMRATKTSPEKLMQAAGGANTTPGGMDPYMQAAPAGAAAAAAAAQAPQHPYAFAHPHPSAAAAAPPLSVPGMSEAVDGWRLWGGWELD